jgi:hypothetical protein
MAVRTCTRWYRTDRSTSLLSIPEVLSGTGSAPLAALVQGRRARLGASALPGSDDRESKS